MSAVEIESLLKKLNISPIELVRKNEDIWKTKFNGKELADTEIIQAMAAYPKLIERPIVETGNIAVICRPPELVLELIKNHTTAS